MKLILIWTLLSVAARAACVEVPSDRIAARDLFDRLPQSSGTVRGHHGGLRALARNGADCFGTGAGLDRRPPRDHPSSGYPMYASFARCIPSHRGEMQAALSSALGIPDAEIEILDFSSQPLPAGPPGIPALLAQPAAAQRSRGSGDLARPADLRSQPQRGAVGQGPDRSESRRVSGRRGHPGRQRSSTPARSRPLPPAGFPLPARCSLPLQKLPAKWPAGVSGRGKG